MNVKKPSVQVQSIAPLDSTFKLHGVLQHEYGWQNQPSKYPQINYYLATETKDIYLDVDNVKISNKSLHELSGKMVEANVERNDSLQNNKYLFRVKSISPFNIKSSQINLKGNKPWVTLLCKFKDYDDEPEPLDYFQNMYENLPGRLDHFWREVSYNNINLEGSKAFDWVVLPKIKDDYMDEDNNPDRSALFNDCTGANSINFYDNGSGYRYFGINMVFNEEFGDYAWGGGRYASLNGGPSEYWRATWIPPWGLSGSLFAHEMGHGFGLPHANNSDGDDDPYDNIWDIMSGRGFAARDPIYYSLGKHINMSYKYRLSWVMDADGFIADASTFQTVTLEDTSKDSSNHSRFIRLPLRDGSSYYVEVRKKLSLYESGLPGDAVIIHHVDWSRQEPAWIIDGDDPPADYSYTEGVMWKLGEVFTDFIDGYQLSINEVTADGFVVTVVGPDYLPIPPL